MQEASAAPTLMLVNHDRPEHTVLRSIAQKAFTPKRVLEDVGPWAEKVVAGMFDRLESPEMDFMESFAVEVPARFLTRLIGTPEEDWPLLRDWGNAFMVTADYTAEQRNQRNREVEAYYTEAVMARYEDIARGIQPPDDLMTAFINVEHGGRTLSPEEVIRFCITLVVAGAETTVYFLGNLIATLLEKPELFTLLQNDRSQLRPFMEESLRRDGPIQRLFRICTQDSELGGVTIRKDEWVALFFASANRDPAVFENPDEFILNRPNIKHHMTFGHGIHFCMGNAVARMEAEKLMNGILDRVTGIELGEGGIKRQSGGLLNYGAESLNIRFLMK
jgi:cytochrome P450